jgi:hypothetical protein
VRQLHEDGYRFTWPPTIESLTPRQRGLLRLGRHAEAYVKQEKRKAQTANRGRPSEFGDVAESRRDAFD